MNEETQQNKLEDEANEKIGSDNKHAEDEGINAEEGGDTEYIKDQIEM